MKIIVGSNGHTAPGWVSTDYPEVDITKPLPYGDYSLEAVFASHVLEHVSGPDCFRFFEEVYRVLQKKGVLRISIPCIGWWLARKHIKGLCIDHGHLAAYNEELVKVMIYGAGFEADNIQRDHFDDQFHHHYRCIGRDLDRIESINLICIK